MSATIRAEVAAAANAALGANRCAPYYRQATRPGDAWVSFARADRDDTGLGFMDAWEVRVVLPQDLADAERWLDEHRDTLADALAPHLILTSIVSVTLVLDTGTVPGVVYEGVRPH